VYVLRQNCRAVGWRWDSESYINSGVLCLVQIALVNFEFVSSMNAIQRGNVASIRGIFPDSAILSEIFVL
jgi:hypothetical protein